MLRAAIFALLLGPTGAWACQTALILTMDVSHSVDPSEYRIQTKGLSAALRDPEIAEILVQDRIALAVVQWSGPAFQKVSLPWRQMFSHADVADFANAVDSMPRAFILSNTATAEALEFSINYFAKAPECNRRVIDMSGDGTPNSGGTTGRQRQTAQRLGITVNGLAIEGIGVAITNFYSKHVVTRDGFVETARGYQDYARAIQKKLKREIARALF